MPDDSWKKTSSKLQSRICVDLYQPYLSFGVDEKIIAKNFKWKYVFISFQFVLCWFYTYSCQLFHFIQGSFVTEFFWLQKYFKLCVGKFITRLIFSIIFVFLLNGVICQMAIDIVGVIVELFAASSKIPFFVPISLHYSTVGSNQSIASDIEFPIFV